MHRSDISSVRIVKINALKYTLIGGVGCATWSAMRAGQWNDDDNSGYTFYWSAIMDGLGGRIGYGVGAIQSGEYTYIIQTEQDVIKLEIDP